MRGSGGLFCSVFATSSAAREKCGAASASHTRSFVGKPTGVAPMAEVAATKQPVLVLNDKDMVPLARRVPKAKHTGDLVEDSRFFQQEQQMKFILIEATHGSLLKIIATKAAAHTDLQCSSVSTLGKLDEKWVADWFCKHSKLNSADIAKMRVADPDSLRHMLHWVLQVPSSARLPDTMRYKQVCDGVFAARAAAVGRLENVGAELLTADGHVQWAKGSYSLVFDQASAKSISHVGGAAVDLPAYVNITKAFQIDANHDDFLAEAKLGAARFKLNEFFTAGVGPHAFPRWSPKSTLMQDLAKTEHAKMQAQLATAAQHIVPPTQNGVEVASKQKRQAAAKKAREVLVTTKLDLAKRRRVTLA